MKTIHALKNKMRRGGAARTSRVVRALFFVALCAPPTPALAQGAQNSWYTQRVTLGGAGLGIENLWSEGAALRSQVVVNGHPMVTMVAGRRYVVVDLLRGAGLVVARHPNAVAQDRARSRPFGTELESLLAQGGEHVGDEDFSGVRCALYRLTDVRGRQEVCVGKSEDEDAPKLPVFLRRWDRETNRSATIQYLNWRSGLTMGANFFKPDSRLALTEFSYEEYVRALQEQKVNFPIFYPVLLHGPREAGTAR